MLMVAFSAAVFPLPAGAAAGPLQAAAAAIKMRQQDNNEIVNCLSIPIFLNVADSILFYPFKTIVQAASDSNFSLDK